MPYGAYHGPDKPDKGQKHGSCNRQLCQGAPALWYNHGSMAWYCRGCRDVIEFDSFNLRNWRENHEPDCGHPMFETAEMMAERNAASAAAE